MVETSYFRGVFGRYNLYPEADPDPFIMKTVSTLISLTLNAYLDS